MFNNRMNLQWLQISLLCLVLTACSGISGGGGGNGAGGGGSFGGGVGEISNFQGATGGGDETAGGGTGLGDSGAGGQPSQGTIPGPKVGSFEVVVTYPDPLTNVDPSQVNEYHSQGSKAMGAVSSDIVSGELVAVDIDSGPFPGPKPFVSLWLMDANKPYLETVLSEPFQVLNTDEWGLLQIVYRIASESTLENCLTAMSVSACHFDGTHYFKSATARVYCPEKNGTKTKVFLPLYPSSTPLDCKNQSSPQQNSAE